MLAWDRVAPHSRLLGSAWETRAPLGAAGTCQRSGHQPGLNAGDTSAGVLNTRSHGHSSCGYLSWSILLVLRTPSHNTPQMINDFKPWKWYWKCPLPIILTTTVLLTTWTMTRWHLALAKLLYRNCFTDEETKAYTGQFVQGTKASKCWRWNFNLSIWLWMLCPKGLTEGEKCALWFQFNSKSTDDPQASAAAICKVLWRGKLMETIHFWEQEKKKVSIHKTLTFSC